ncbi:helix-turn-helix domain-containing protein [Porphyromonas sp. COT-108 OH2963]|uniref:helix-turn-helix domain-containing protein n=1 Tax=Porphyromonas sp. COT-108 OH2963 TaxID=1515614 RepID=UPI00068AE8DB|nr:helix-turn-helix transcriptional regulator [Porphyromonas sp. COT-108 OH2963]
MQEEIVRLRIKEILKERGMQVKDLAEMLGKSRSYISDIMNCKKGISISSLTDIARALDVEFRDLFIYTRKNEVVGVVRVNDITYTLNSIEDIKSLVESLRTSIPTE